MLIEAETVVVGAGLAGLTLAAGLAAAGRDVAVLDKSRGLGGRLATRRGEGSLRFDHGAPCVQGSDAGFAALLGRLTEAGAATPWHEGAEPGAVAPHVGLPGISGLVKPLAEGLAIHRGCTVAHAARRGGRWHLGDAEGAPIAVAARLALAIPAPQAARLLGEHPAAGELQAVAFMPNWTMMAAFDAPLPLPDRLREASADLGWVLRDGAKPGRGEAQTWVVQASDAFSRERLEDGQPDIAAGLLASLRALAGEDLPPPVSLAAHRWRFARAAAPLGRPCLSIPDDELVIAGDWCLGPDAQSAYLSGMAARAAFA